ncbi:MAG: TetR/AcrR family transcriptional regulator [Sneathiella sp.]|nr:TetR/AcrR family transcriptional regulator [Sneathiella sp.]
MTVENKQNRKESLKAFKRRHILEAARQLYDTAGFDGLNMRAIAKASGYSLGAAYAYFRTKEEIQAELLALVLTDLSRHIRNVMSQEADAARKAANAFVAFYRYFQAHPKNRQLYLSVFAGPPARDFEQGSTTNKELNSKLLGLMGLLANGLHQGSALSASDAQSETIDAVTYISGLLLLETSGKMDLMNQNGQEMVDRYMHRMLLRTQQ